EAGISLRTYKRWYQNGKVLADKRPDAVRPEPSNKLYRGRSAAPKGAKAPATFEATGPCQVFCWDITYLPSNVRGQFYYLYMLEDLFSRKIVGNEVYEQESGELAAELLQRTLIRENCLHSGVVLHSDNGAPMKSQTMRAKAYDLGVTTSYSRPRVSNDNPFAESLFRTCKYRPEWPSNGFKSLARMGVEIYALVQLRTQAQQVRFCDASSTSHRPRQSHLGSTETVYGGCKNSKSK